MDFYHLQPDIILNAVESLGFNCTGHIQQLNSLENRVFDLKLEQQNHIVVKFYRPKRWSVESIREEHQFVHHLESQEIPVCAPMVIEQETLFEHNDLGFAIWPRTGGRLVDEFTPELVKRLGSYLARIHNQSQNLTMNHRPFFDPKHMISRHLEFLFQTPNPPSKYQKELEELTSLLTTSLQRFLSESDQLLLHGDCHFGNILLGDQTLFFLDFDDCMIGPALQDIWMIVSDSPEQQKQKIDLFLEGYEQFRSFPSSNLKYIEMLRAIRYLAHAGWIARRFDDPAVMKTFPDFASDDYWAGFVQDLEDQISLMGKQGSLSTSESNPESAVSTITHQEEEWQDNDYFYDLDEDGERWSPGS